jgi:hypothetical protein
MPRPCHEDSTFIPAWLQQRWNKIRNVPLFSTKWMWDRPAWKLVVYELDALSLMTSENVSLLLLAYSGS